MQRPWIPFYPSHYLADTQHLSTAQHGAYLLLILHYWTHEGLPDDDGELAKITKLPLKSWRAMRPALQLFFHDGWRHKRIDHDLVSIRAKTEKRKRAGSRGGTASAIARWGGKQLVPKAVSKRAAKPQQNYKQSSSILNKDITTTFSDAARAREKNPEISTTGDDQRPANPSTTPPKISSQSEAPIGSGELRALVLAKGWG